MKKSFIILVFFLIAIAATAQQNNRFKSSNTIEIDGGNLKQFTEYLLEKGLFIEETTATSIKSQRFELYKTYHGYSGELVAAQSEQILVISGMAYSFGSMTAKMESKSSGHMATRCFNKVEELAVGYAKKYNLMLKYSRR